MAYTAGFTAITGATFTAAQYNTNVRDNFSAIWAYTTAGDIVYASSATALARLGIGASGKYLKSTGSAPSWADLTTVNACILKLLADKSIANSTYTVIDWTSEEVDTNGMHSTGANKSRITIAETGYYYMAFLAVFEAANSGFREALILKNGTTVLWKSSMSAIGGGRDNVIACGFDYLSAGDYLTAQVWHNQGVSINLLYSDNGLPYKYAYSRFEAIKLNP